MNMQWLSNLYYCPEHNYFWKNCCISGGKQYYRKGWIMPLRKSNMLQSIVALHIEYVQTCWSLVGCRENKKCHWRTKIGRQMRLSRNASVMLHSQWTWNSETEVVHRPLVHSINIHHLSTESMDNLLWMINDIHTGDWLSVRLILTMYISINTTGLWD